METLRICPNCRKPLPPDVPLGLCPECLIKSGFPTEGGPGVPGEVAGARFVPPPVEEIAQLFPQLEILSLIGKGGMGAVYKARQPMLDRFIALKVLPPAVAGDPGFAERFTREARALAKLNHPNIVAVYDFGKAGSLHYLLMEFVDGTNLREVEQARKLSPEQAVTIVPKICEALQYAHDQGVVHRDIKPENILLDKSGRVKIADFGIAKMVGQGPTEVSLTGAKDVVGTPHYMAPEQIERPQEVDHRADIYSLGVVFYEMLTGELPLGKFAAPSKKVHVDVRLDEVVLHTLEKEPSRRYQQVSEVKSDVETITGAAGSARKGDTFAVSQTASDKILFPTLLMATFFGLFGAHRFYVGKVGTGFAQLGALIACILLIIANAHGVRQPEGGLMLAFVAFGCVIWATMDWILILCKAFTDGQGKRMTHWLHPQDGTAKSSVSSPTGPPPSPPSGPPPSGVPPVAGAGSPPPPMASGPVSTISTGIIVAPALALLITASLKLAVALGVFTTNEWHRTPGFQVVIFMILPALGVLWGAFNMLRLNRYGWAITGAVLAMIAPPWYLVGVPVGIWALIVLARQDVREEFARVNVSSTRSSPWPWLVAAGIGLVLVVICIMAVVSLVREIAAEKPTGLVDAEKISAPTEPEAVEPPPAAPAVAPAGPTSGFQPIRISAGSSRPKVDHEGNWWLPDQGFAGGETSVRPNLAIVNTPDPELYRSERYGMNSFSYPVPNGKYQVKLHFAETYEDITGPGKRVFTFIVEGHEFKDFDVWAEAGGAQRACVKTVDVDVTDGRLTIYFVPEQQNPQINGIEILPVPSVIPTTNAPPPSTDDNSSVTMNISSPSGRVVIAVTNGASPSSKVQIEAGSMELSTTPTTSDLTILPAAPVVSVPPTSAPPKSAGTPSPTHADREKIMRDLSTMDPYRQDFNRTLPLSAHGRLRLDNVNGRIEIAGWDRNEVVVKALKHGKTQESVAAVKINVDSSPDKIVIHTEQPSVVTGFPSGWFGFGDREKASVDYLVQVPQRARLDKIDSVNGDIVIDGVSGDTETSSVNGATRIRGAADNLKVSTVNGGMDVELASLGGDQSVSLDTVNGAIEAILPANANARVTADTLNGGLSSEFPELVVKKQFPVSKHLKGALGNGSATVKANSVNGSIRFRRGDDAQ